MFSSSCNNFSGSSYYCSICKQRFQTEKNFKRHNNSRKHIKQTRFIKRNANRMNERSLEFDLLPNDVIEYLISDLAGQVFEKDTFFNDIQLLDKNDSDMMTVAAPEYTTKYEPHLPKRLHSRMEINPMVYRVNQPSIRRIPAIYPCLTCFQLLDSQENFDAHMLEAHFNGFF